MDVQDTSEAVEVGRMPPTRGGGGAGGGRDLDRPESVLRLLHRVERLVEAHETLAELLPPVLEALCAAGTASAAHVTPLDRSGPEGRPGGTDLWHVPAGFGRLDALREAMAPAPDGAGAAGGGAAVATGPVGALLPADQAEAARKAGLPGLLMFVVRAGADPVVRVELFSRMVERPPALHLQAIDLVRRRLDSQAARDRARAAVTGAAEHCRELGARLQSATIRVRALEERRALLSRGTRDGLWEWDLQSGQARFSTRWASLLGLDAARVGEGPGEWLDRIHPEDRPGLREAIEALRAGSAALLEREHRLRCADGEWRPFIVRAVASRDDSGRALRLAGSLSAPASAPSDPAPTAS